MTWRRGGAGVLGEGITEVEVLCKLRYLFLNRTRLASVERDAFAAFAKKQHERGVA